MKRKVLIMLLILCVSLPPWTASKGSRTAAVLYVKPSASGGGDCSDWANACTLQTALGTATVGDEIWVAAGVHKPTAGMDREATFQLVSGVAVYGGFAAAETLRIQRDWETHITVLSGDIDDNDVTDPNGVITTTTHISGTNSYHVVVAGSGATETAILDGFTVTGGQANAPPGTPGTHAFGGGMRNFGSPALTHVAFIGNYAEGYGAGTYNGGDGSPTFTDVNFIGNKSAAASYGGGMYNAHSKPELISVTFSSNVALGGGGMCDDIGGYPTLTNVTFTGNTAAWGGGMWHRGGGVQSILTDVGFYNNSADYGGGMNAEYSDLKLTNVTFNDNSATQNGGGMYTRDSDLELTNVTFNGNSATQNGGAMYNDNSDPTLTDVSFVSNTATYDGGGVYNGGYNPGGSNPGLVNVVFRGNAAAQNGGGMYNDESAPKLVNVTFISNTATYDGGGMYNQNSSSPTLANALFNGNQAQNHGGGILNIDSSPALTNTTFSANSAQVHGGGMYNQDSAPTIVNSILWGNHDTTGDGQDAQVHNVGTTVNLIARSLVQGGCPSGASCVPEPLDADPQFLDTDGPDDIPGTADDDLRLLYTSPAIDYGDNDALPPDTFDLDGDEDRVEKLPLDLAGNPRITGLDQVDLGAYELADCFGHHIIRGDWYLSEGQKYRQGFHAELDITATIKIADVLVSYAEIGLSNLDEAKQDYRGALECAVTVTETDQAMTGLLDAHWESATGAMLTGNEFVVQALDIKYENPANPLDEEIGQLQEAINWYTQATDGYTALLASEYFTDLMSLQISRTHPIDGKPTPYLDLQRLALAAAKKSRAYLELAERQYRGFTSDANAEAERALRQGFGLATAELTLLEHLWDGAVDDVSYHALLRNISDMQRLFDYLQEGKNPFGYGPEFVPFHFDPDNLPQNNYEQTKALADVELGTATTHVNNAVGKQQESDDNYVVLQQRLADIASQYNSQLVSLCGTNGGGDPDLEGCHSNQGGDIYYQLLRVQEATQRVQLVLQQMENQNELIRIEQERAARVAGIQRATAIMYSQTGEKLASLASQEAKLRFSKSTAQGITGILEGVFSGAMSGGAFGPWGALAGGLFGGMFGATNWFHQADVADQLADVAAEKERLRAMQSAAVHYAEAEITDAESEALIKQYMLRFAEYDIELLIALNNLQQELARLNGMTTQVEYLQAEKRKAQAFAAAMYQDPAGRVMRDYYMELAHDRFGVALDYVFRAGRALEYEINWDPPYTGLPLTDLDDLYNIRDIVTLNAALAQMNTAYNAWRSGRNPQSTPDDVVYLSQAVGFEDAYDPDLGRIVTREEKFNTFVRDQTNNWVDLDGDDEKESLQFTFQTSIFVGNKFFSTNVFNDKIESIKVRVRGINLGDDRVVILLKQSGTSFIRTENAFQGGGPDDVREYNVAPLTARIVATTNDSSIPQVNQELATRSVAFTNWTLTLDKVNEPNNLDVDIEGIEEIELIITHEAYTLQTLSGIAGRGASPQGKRNLDTFQPPPNRPYRPIGTATGRLPLVPSPNRPVNVVSPARVGSTDLTGAYVGTAIITHPLHLSPLDLIVVLIDTNGSLNGYVDAPSVLGYPIVDEGSGRGPALAGSLQDNGFALQSEVYTGTGITSTRQVVLHTGVISDSGKTLTGVYSETLWGLTPHPITMFGDFTLRRSPGLPHQVYLPIVCKN
jgi:predicted outer membrane repeat protein